MRKGTTYKLRKFPKFNLQAGSLDKYNPKSLFVSVSGHFETKDEDPQKLIRSMVYKIKRSVSERLYNSPFTQRHIANVTYPESIAWTGKCFFEVEFTLFYKEPPKQKPIEWLNTIGEMLQDHSNNENYTIINRRTRLKRY